MDSKTTNTNQENGQYLYENMTPEEKDKYDGMIQNLPVLQDKINRDHASYMEEFRHRLEIFKGQFNIILFTPNKSIKSFKELLLFFSHISNIYPTELAFIPEGLIRILQENYLIIPHEMRLAMVDSLSLLRKKDLLTPLEVLPLFFNLLKCQDKILRKKLCDCIISDLTKINQNHKKNEINRSIQNYCEKLLHDTNKKLARKTLNIMITLYQKKIWNDARTVNAIGAVVGVNDEKMSRAACQFFLSEYEVDQVDTSSEEELDELKNKYKLLGKANSRKTKARKNKLKMLMKSIERKEKRHSKVTVNKDFMPIDLLNNPALFCEELFKKAQNSKVGFSIKLIIIRLLGRVLGRHRLLLDNYFNYMLNFITPNQKDIGLIMASLIEACHDQVPPVELEPIMTKLFDNFISENFSAPVVTLGLNTLREIIERCPYCINKSQYDQVINLKEYKHKSVSNAARSVVNLCKEIDGKFGKVDVAFGTNKVDDTIEGIELLKKLEKKPKDYRMEYEEILDDKQLKKLKALKLKYNAELIQHKKTGITDKDINEMVGDDDDGNDGDEEEEGEEEEGELEEIEDDGEELELEPIEDEEGEEEEGELEEIPDDENISLSEHSGEEVELSSDELESSEGDDEEDDQGFVDPENLLAYHKTRREKREELKNQEKEKFKVNKKKKTGGKTNKEKEKNKPYMMVAPKKRLQSKIKSSKLQSMNKKIKGLKQQLGRFKRGNMVLKKKGGLIGKKKKR